MDAIIGQFLDFARGADEQKSTQDLNHVAADLAEHYARLGKNVEFHESLVPRFPFARIAVRRAIANLVDNALRYAGEPIEIEMKREKELVFVEIRDRGPGIPQADIERLKQPFTRLDSSRRGPAGSGLGLAIVERIAEAHGGRLELTPREGGGLIARLVLSTYAATARGNPASRS
jgi:two-component system osmolarity sensor histidine kinase EnvZ